MVKYLEWELEILRNAIYIHGTSKKEQARLALLNRLTNESFIRFLDLHSNDEVLEVGSGLGILSSQIAKRVPRGSVEGVEASKEQLAAAKRSVSNLHFLQGDAHHLPFEDNSFDLVFCRYVLEHVKNPLQVLKEMRRVLKPKGRIRLQENNIAMCIFDPDCPHFDKVWRQFIALQHILGGDALIGKRLFSLLKKAGFHKIELSFESEIHLSGQATFRPWIENVLGNITGGTSKLLEHHLVSKNDISKAIFDLKKLLRIKDASALFYWNRAKAVK